MSRSNEYHHPLIVSAYVILHSISLLLTVHDAQWSLNEAQEKDFVTSVKQ